MRSGLMVQVFSLLAACALVPGCSGGKELSPLSDEEAYQRFVGRWVNTDYPGTMERTQVTVIRPDYVMEDWLYTTTSSPTRQWSIRVKKVWVDEKGDTYCQMYNTVTQPADMRDTCAGLMRVDKKGKVWELCIKPFGFGRIPSFEEAVYPERIDPSLQFYWIYYRKK